MRARTVGRVLLLASLAVSTSARATTIPPDLEAHAARLRRTASPQVLAWAHDEGVALAKARGPIDVAALERSIRARFGAQTVPSAGSGAPYPNLGSLGDSDIMALAFIVMMEASKSAQGDLKAIMDGVKAINSQKEMSSLNRSKAGKFPGTPAPTPVPDRVSQLVSAAQGIHARTLGANLSTTVRR